MKKYITAAVLVCCLAGCAGSDQTTAGDQADEELVIYCPHPLGLINPVISEFESRTGIAVRICTGGTGELISRIATKEDPRCDVLWGGSLTSVRPRADLFENYISANENEVQEEFKNTEGNLTRFTDMPSVIMINTNLLGDIPVHGYADLLNPQLKGRIAMCSPAGSSSSWEQLINMLYAMGKGDPEAGWDYVQDLVKNLDGVMLEGSAQVYQGVAEGRFAVGLTFEEGAAHYVGAGEPVQIVYMEEGVISRPDVVAIVKGTDRRDYAEQFVDFVTGKDAQTMIASRLDRRTVRKDVEAVGYLPDKEQIPVIYDEEELTARKKAVWLERFQEIWEETRQSSVPPQVSVLPQPSASPTGGQPTATVPATSPSGERAVAK